MTLAVRAISRETHLGFLRGGVVASYLQCPGAAGLRGGWRNESIGWYNGTHLCGVALVSYRDVPLVGALAYVAEGPASDWSSLGVEAVTRPLLAFLRGRRVFTVRLTPAAVLHRWEGDTLRQALKDGGARRFRDVEPDTTSPVGAGLVG